MEFYHVLNRGVDKRDVVMNDGDRMRFVRGLYLFNDSHPAPNGVTQKRMWTNLTRTRDKLVDIHAWCLMNNHYHLLLSPVNDDISRLSLFMKKLNMGYAKFFNEKYGRSGYLWQGKYRKIQMKQDSHFMYIPYYIHLNPLDFKYSQWRTGKLTTTDEPLSYLLQYRWSSCNDYWGIHNFPSIINRNILDDILGGIAEQQIIISEIISDKILATDSGRIET